MAEPERVVIQKTAGVSTTLWSVEELAERIEARAATPAKRGP
jgi:hypothetical protein